MRGLLRGAPGRARAAAGLVALALAVAVVYGKSLPFSFQYDDFRNIVHNPAIRVHSLSPAELWGVTGQTRYVGDNRPLAYRTFAVNRYLGGDDPWGFRLVNVGIHAAAAALVFWLACRLSSLTGGPRRPGWAWAAAALWALHPVQTGTVVYVVQRMTSLATLLYLGGLLAYLRGRCHGRPLWFAPAAVLFYLACQTKEIAFAFPALLALVEVAFFPPARRLVARFPWLIAAVPAVGAVALAAALHLYRPGYAEYTFTWQQRVLTEWRVVAHYLGLLALPHPSRLVADYHWSVSTGLLAPATTLAALAFHLGLLAAGAWALIRRPLYGFAVLAFYLHLVIESTVIPLDLVFEHRLYLPSAFLLAGACAAVADGARWAAGRGWGRANATAAALAVALALLGATWSWQRLDAWRDPITLWLDVLAKQPDSARAHGNLGKEYHQRGDLGAARRHLTRAYQLDPRDARIPANLARVEADAGDPAKGLAILLSLERQGLRDHIIYADIGWLQTRLGRLAEAAVAYEKALSYEARMPGINYLLADLYLRLGDPPKARDRAARELALNPAHEGAQRFLAALGSRR